MKIKVKWPCCLVLILLLLSITPLTVSAETDDGLETMPEAYVGLEEVIPEDVAEIIPEGLFSPSPEEALSAAEEMTRPEYLFKVLLEAVGLKSGEVISLLATLLGLVLLAAILRHLRDAVTGRIGEGFSFCLRLCMYALTVSRAVDMVVWVQAYFDRLNTLLGGLIPVMGTLYALGGNLGQAAVNEEILLIFLTVCEYVTTYVTPALCGLCLAFALLDAFGGGLHVRLAPLSGMFKKWYTSLLGLVMFLLAAALSAQTVLVSKADTLSMKGVKYAVGNMLPVVGGAVSGTLGSVAAGVGMLRGVTGVCGIVLVALLLLPTLVSLLLFRFGYNLSATVASMLGCDGESRLLGEIGSLYGYMAAAVSICAVLCVLALGIFAHSAAAMG